MKRIVIIVGYVYMECVRVCECACVECIENKIYKIKFVNKSILK